MATGGFNFGNMSAPASSSKTPFSFGAPASQPTASAGGSAGFSLSALSSATNPPSSAGTSSAATGLSFGAQPAKPASGGFSFGGSSSTAAPTTQPPTFNLATATTNAQSGLTLGAQSTASLSKPGATLTMPAASSATATATTGAPNLTLGGLGGGTATNKGFGFGNTTTSATTGFSFGGNKIASTTAGQTVAASGGLTLGGLGGTTSQAPQANTTSKGLGGVDPRKDSSSSGGSAGKSGNGKAVKEQNMPNELVGTVTKFKDYVKEQKEVREKIMMMSSQSMFKIKEQTESLRHLLSTVAMGLQRNIVAVDKLKNQTSQELQSVEMAHRTKETPAGLQYENTAPSEYFSQLLESFESRMCLYRKLIEDTEGFLTGAQQNTAVSTKELFICLKRLHETFIALAAQLQGVHEKVKEHKEQYLAYRKVFHNDDTNVFAVRRKADSDRSKMKRTTQPLGPTPFTGLSNFAAMKMTAAMSRQNPQPSGMAGFGGLNTANQPPTSGLFGGASSNSAFGGFGVQTSKPTSFGFSTQPTNTSTGGLFGKPAQTNFSFGNTTTSKSTGFGFGNTGTATSAPGTGFSFGSSTTTQQPNTAFGFGTSNTATSGGLFGSQTAAVKPLGVAAPQSLGSSAPAFSLQQPPSKRSSNQ